MDKNDAVAFSYITDDKTREDIEAVSGHPRLQKRMIQIAIAEQLLLQASQPGGLVVTLTPPLLKYVVTAYLKAATEKDVAHDYVNRKYKPPLFHKP